jgi:peptidoglycan hydrolase-like protein with peptidoglycan-binding domain
MDDTEAMLRHSHDVLAELSEVPEDTLVAPMGKDWSWTNRLAGRPDRSAEYGLQPGRHQGVTPGVTVWQPGPSLAHESTYTDYSMCPAPVRARMLVDGEWKSIVDIAKDPELHWLVSSEGVLTLSRHPGVPRGDDTLAPPRVQPLFTRTLKRGCSPGDDVALWQGVVGVDRDGIFGKRTEVATKDWQSRRDLVPDGVVGPKTRNAAAADLAGTKVPPGTIAADFPVSSASYVPAVNQTKATGRKIRLLVLHSMEAPEKPSTAEAVAGWFGGKNGKAPAASSHLCVDCDSVVECVKPENVAWCAPGANRDGYHIEHAGFARQTRDEWLDAYSEQMLVLSAKAARAKVMLPHGIPARHLSDAELARGLAGVVDHHAVSRVYRQSDHVDVGKGFPWDVYLGFLADR